MGKRARKTRSKRGPNRSDETVLAELEAELATLEARMKGMRAFSPDAILEERDRLEVSAADYATLVGVSMPTIYNWEHGRSVPQAGQLARWMDVRGIGKREAWRRLGLI